MRYVGGYFAWSRYGHGASETSYGFWGARRMTGIVILFPLKRCGHSIMWLLILLQLLLLYLGSAGGRWPDERSLHRRVRQPQHRAGPMCFSPTVDALVCAEDNSPPSCIKIPWNCSASFHHP